MSEKDEKKRWEKELLKPLTDKYPERQEEFTTPSGIPLPEFLTPEEINLDFAEALGFPGEFPFTRGVQPNMHRGRLWTMRQYAGFASPEETNQRFHYLLKQGQSGLSVAFDLPTQIGYDADDPLAAGEVGKVGVPISSLEDMQSLLEGIPLDKVSTSMTINAPAAILLAMYVAVAKSQGVAPNKLRGTVQNDILKEYIARGTYIFPPKPSLRLATDIFKYCEMEVPRWNSISVSGYHIREAGSTAVQEVAFTLANAIVYVEQGLGAGMDIDNLAGQISFFFNAHNHFLEEIAKFRAARRLWARIMRTRFGAQNPKSQMLRFHAQTAGSTLTAQQPENNVVRVAVQALAAIMGGAQSLHTNSMDEALWLPTEKAVRVALRTQQILAHESKVGDSVDPLGGSYLIEYLTNEIESRAQIYLDEIEKRGGSLAAIESGYIQSEIQEAAYQFQQALESNEELVVGMNAFEIEEDIDIDRLSVDPALEMAQRANLAVLRARRDQVRVDDLLNNLERAARGTENLMPLIIECVENEVTLGEICGRLRQIWGEYQPSS
ncbi:MAG: methylmalonyl-CoA mutase family protein [Chloroflexi bacterium]|nr:methylmalonyl-CoA mutase family protein [Chloroflexota bacterium]